MHRISLLLLSCLMVALAVVVAAKHHHDDGDDSAPPPYAAVPAVTAQSSSSQYLVRTAAAYQLIANDSASGPSVVGEWNISDVSARIRANLPRHQFKRDSKVIKHYLRRLNHRADLTTATNHSHGHGHGHHGRDKHRGKHNEWQLMSFYLNHAQCRQCVSSNLDILQSTTVPSLPSYQPTRIMKFCPLIEPRLTGEVSPLITGRTLMDFEGHCVPAESECPINSVDMNVLDASTCHNDDAATKLSCTLCVLDGYQWATTKHAYHRGDNYDGQCVNPISVTMAATGSGWHSPRYASTLDQCPVSPSSQSDNSNNPLYYVSHLNLVSVLFVVLVLFTCCWCCFRRKQAQRATLVAQPLAAPMAQYQSHTVSASQSDQYPGNTQSQSTVAASLLAPSLPQAYGPSYPLVQPAYNQPSAPVYHPTNNDHLYYRL